MWYSLLLTHFNHTGNNTACYVVQFICYYSQSVAMVVGNNNIDNPPLSMYLLYIAYAFDIKHNKSECECLA